MPPAYSDVPGPRTRFNRAKWSDEDQSRWDEMKIFCEFACNQPVLPRYASTWARRLSRLQSNGLKPEHSHPCFTWPNRYQRDVNKRPVPCPWFEYSGLIPWTPCRFIFKLLMRLCGSSESERKPRGMVLLNRGELGGGNHERFRALFRGYWSRQVSTPRH